MPVRRLFAPILAALIISLSLPASAQEAPLAAQVGDPPIASLITISEPDAGGVVTITGVDGAVFPRAAVAVRNLYTGETVYTNANGGGAFSVQLYGPGNTPFWISPAEQIAAADQGRPGPLPGGPGVILYGSFPQRRGDSIPFTLSGTVGGGSGSWQAEGSINKSDFATGDTLALELRITMNAPGRVSDNGDFRLGARLRLESLSGGGNGWSGILTPGGMPIEGIPGGLTLGETEAQYLSVEGDVLTFDLNWRIDIDGQIPPGDYVLVIEGYAGVTGVTTTWTESGVLGQGENESSASTRLPLMLQIGETNDPARLLWTLFQDDPSQGSRGILADEDQGAFGVSSHAAFNTATYALPRLDPATGEPIPYPLEPYLPALLSNSYFESISPLIPLRFPSGELRVAVTRPDGSVDDLGSAPFVQNRLSTPAHGEADTFGAGSSPDLYYSLTTLDPRFTAYTFEQDGPYGITLTGTVEDVWGRAYTGGGTYHVWIGEPLAIAPGVLPGTPFEVGDTFYPGLNVLPGVPADVSIRLQVFPLDGGEATVYEAGGAATRNGTFQPQVSDLWRFDSPGEYVVDYFAHYEDASGRQWIGSRRGAGVIASPEGSLIARGGRGVANVPSEDRLAWYALDHVAPGLLIENPDASLRWPYFGGDVLWARDGESRVMPALHVTDTSGEYTNWLLDRFPDWRSAEDMSLAELANEDELPLLSDPASGTYAYAYLSAVRPDSAARQMIRGYEPAANFASAGWTLDDPYSGQAGVGLNGDLPGDVLFLFGGLIIWGEETGLSEAAIYGSMVVVVDPDDPRGDRVYPPLGLYANGPDGGPLLTIRDQPVEMFFHPTSFRPGQVFVVNDRLALAGQVAPTLPAQVEATVIAPSGQEYAIGGQANAIGYFYDPAQDVLLNEPGPWLVRVNVTFGGITSAGQAQPPFPSGGVLGAENGEFAVYVVPPDTPTIPLTQPAALDAMLPPAQPITIAGNAPEGWTETSVHYTVAMPGVILESGPLNTPGGTFSYTYSPRALAQTFPNLDVVQTGTQTPTAADVVTITVFLSGLDADGDPAFAARTVTVLGSRVIVGE